MAIQVDDDNVRQQSQLQLTAKTGKGRSKGTKGSKGLWRPSAEVAQRHTGEWRYLAKTEGEFRIQLSERGTLLFCCGDASGVLLPQEKRWLQAELHQNGEDAGTARVHFSEKTETMMYASRPVGAECFEEATPAYRIMTLPEANRCSAEDAIAVANKASRILEKGLASASAGSWDQARRELKCVLQDLEASSEHWEDGTSRSQLVASGKCLVVLRLRGLCAEAMAGMAECSLKGETPPNGMAALTFAEQALKKDPTCLEALLQKGLALLELGRPSEAEHILQEGLQANGSAVLARSAPESQEVLDQLETFLQDEALLQKVQKLRETGNEHVRQGQYEAAAWCYEDCLQVLWGKDLIFPSEVAERAKRPCTGLWRQIRSAETAVVTNLSLCCLQGQKDWAPSPERAIQLCTIALTYDPEHVKAMRRMGHAYCALHHYEDAERRMRRQYSHQRCGSGQRMPLSARTWSVHGVKPTMCDAGPRIGSVRPSVTCLSDCREVSPLQRSEAQLLGLSRSSQHRRGASELTRWMTMSHIFPRASSRRVKQLTSWNCCTR